MSKLKLTNKLKRDILIAGMLLVCLAIGIASLILVEDKVGVPIYYEGDIKNICVRINEICSSNNSIIADENGNFSDYIELYNYGDTFLMTGFGLSDDTSNSVSYTFGEIEFGAGEHMIVFLDGINVPFRLNGGGNEYIALVAFDGTVICSATTVASASNQVMLYSDAGYTVSDTPSPGFPNTEQGVSDFKNGSIDSAPELVISEVFIANGSSLPDFEGDFCDIIELRNATDRDISLDGYFLSDDEEFRYSYALPAITLEAGKYLVVFASGKGTVTDSGEIHADFKLSEGERVCLSKANKYTYCDAVYGGVNLSNSRMFGEDGTIGYGIMTATPGFSNDESGITELQRARWSTNGALVISEVLLSSDELAYGGSIRDVIEITNISDGEVSTEGWYLSDSEDDPYEYALPVTTLAPGETAVLYAERSDSAFATGFALSESETLYLTSPEFKIASSVSCVPAGRGNSLNRGFGDDGEYFYSDTPSIGFANDDQGKKACSDRMLPDTVRISEAVSVNNSYLAGPYGTYYDFCELYNPTDSDIYLDGWFISDDPETIRKASLDGIKVPAYGYAVIILTTDGKNAPSGYPVVGISLSSGGETLLLSNGDTVIDCMVIPALGSDASFGRPDGESGFALLSSATPKQKNSDARDDETASPTASVNPGVFDGITNLKVELSGEGTIYYTLDCTTPDASSAVYTGPFTLTSTTVIRCCAIKDGCLMSDVVDLTYVINEGHQLEVVSLVTEPDNLWDYYHGIYVTGPGASSEFPYVGANYWQQWEKEASVSFYAADGSGFYEPCGIRIFGAYSRALAMKSISCFFRSEYGCSELEYQLFTDSDIEVYEAFILRNTGQDFKKARMRDAMIASLVGEMTDVDVQNSRPVVLYLNGEFWGVYYIREKINTNYFAAHYNVSDDKVEIARASGTNSESYQAMIKFVKNNSLAVQENYDYVCSLVDIDNYMDYIIAEIYIGNTDNGNIRFYQVEGMKWRWIMFDVDHGFRSVNTDTVADHLNPGGTGSMNRFPTTLINGLLKNNEFKDAFLRRFAWQIDNIWNVDKVIARIELFESRIEHDMQRDCVKWENSYSSWQSEVESLKYFARNRESYVLDDIQAYFNLSDSQMREYGFNID